MAMFVPSRRVLLWYRCSVSGMGLSQAFASLYLQTTEYARGSGQTRFKVCEETQAIAPCVQGHHEQVRAPVSSRGPLKVS